MFGVLVLLILAPLSVQSCSSVVMGELDSQLVYQEDTMAKLVGLQEHTILYNIGNYPMTVGKVCTTSTWHEDETGKYRIISTVREDGCITNYNPFRVDIEINQHTNGMVETWPDGTKFDVYVLHLQDNVLAIYGCEAPNGLEKERNIPFKTFTTITKATKKQFSSNDGVEDAVKKLTEKLGLVLGTRLDWCPRTSYEL